MRTFKAALRASGTHALVSLALALMFTLAALQSGGSVRSEIPLGVGLLLAVLPWPGLLVLSAFPGRPVSEGLGFSKSDHLVRRTRLSATAVGVLVLVCALAVALHVQLWIRAVLIISAIAIASVATFHLVRILGSMKRQRAALRRAIGEFGPEFILYTGRPEGGAYQIQQWLPQLLAISPRVLVVVRHQSAVHRLAPVLPEGVPLVCCQENQDLDDVVIPSVRAAFYVNSVTSNANLVSYRGIHHIYLGHGDSDKEISAHPVHRMYDAIFVAGQAAIDRYAMHKVHLDDGQARIIGRPQLEGIERVTDPPSSPKTVLYTPTWSGYNQATSLSSLAFAQPFIADLITRGIRVLFRPHPFSQAGSTDAVHVAAIDAQLAADGGAHMGSKVTSSMSLIDLFNVSDAMVTDVSSVLIDYLAAEKPVAVLISTGSVPGENPKPHSSMASEAASRYPSIRHAYLADSPTADAWKQMLTSDFKRESRERAAAYYLGGTSSSLFREAVQSLGSAAGPSS
ncbi:CDP-glycerol glycerophosphotransferase family protein [Arthrobacter sp.]|uniref:CDP-glycerol glycerophosphotransferase family protein n=1 Tax=Arthrobacter sp. TaxID=1667 RepID=UPI003A9244C1